MGAHRNWGTALTLATMAAVSGCQPPPPAPPTPSVALSQPAPPTTAPATEPTPGSPEDLARKAEAWTKMMEALQAKRQAATTAPANDPDTDWVARANAARLPTSRPVPDPVQAAAPDPEPAIATSQPAPPTGATPALVFSPPPATAPVIEIHPPATTQPIPQILPTKPKVIVKDELTERVRDSLKNAPRDPAANLDYQLVRFLRDEQTPDLASLSDLSAEDREAVAALMDGLANFRAGLRADPNSMVSKKVRPLVEMGDRLRAQGDLRIPSAALCTTVRGYGLYDPITAPFPEGRENKALLYCEVSGFASRLGDGGMWDTRLTQEVVLYRGDTEAWKKGKVDEITDHCRNKRRDFYLMNLIQLPASLPAGSYTLKVTVIDQVANRVAETVVPVTIAAAGVAGAK